MKLDNFLDRTIDQNNLLRSINSTLVKDGISTPLLPCIVASDCHVAIVYEKVQKNRFSY